MYSYFIFLECVEVILMHRAHRLLSESTLILCMRRNCSRLAPSRRSFISLAPDLSTRDPEITATERRGYNSTFNCRINRLSVVVNCFDRLRIGNATIFWETNFETKLVLSR